MYFGPSFISLPYKPFKNNTQSSVQNVLKKTNKNMLTPRYFVRCLGSFQAGAY